MKNLIKRFIRNEEGQDLIEYALLIFFIAIVVMVMLDPLGDAVAVVYGRITTALS